MPDAPRRISVHDQLIALLREGIVGGRWRGVLPTEQALCRDFQVSRMTLRKALAQLANEKWIELGGRGRSHRVLRRPRKKPAVEGRIVRVLTPFHPETFSSPMQDMLHTVTNRLMSAGYHPEVEHQPRLFEHFQPSKLARLDSLPDTAGWILYYTTPAIQDWFARRGRPAVVVGRAADAQRLSSVHLDEKPLARHAAGLFFGRGHREMVYLIASVTSITDRLVAETFEAEAKRLGARARVVEYVMEFPAIHRRMMDLLASRPRPTAYLVGANETAITVLCHLLSAGIRVPDEASVVSAVDDYHLRATFPTVARYRVDPQSMGRKVAESVIGQIRNGTGRIVTTPIMPEFVEGGSLRPGPS